jgi:hypothetical protein
MNRPGARVVAGVVARMEVHLLEARHARAPQPLLAGTSGRHGQTEHTHHRRGLYPAKVRLASGNGLGRHPALAIRRARERQHGVLPREHIRHFDHVTDRPDLRIRCAHLRIDDDATARTDLEAGRLGQLGLGSHADGEFYSPAAVLMIDLDDNRLRVAQRFGATNVINSGNGQAVERVLELTAGTGVDVAVEAVGTPATFDICQSILAPGGHLANVGVHGRPVELHVEKLWDRNITLTTRLVDTVTTPMLLKVVRSGKLQPSKLVTHRFALDDVMKAYDTFGNAAKEGALKVILKNQPLALA